MGRPEKPEDPSAGPVQEFASELRRLREAVPGGLTYRRMAAKAGYSSVALSTAAQGKKLPSLEVTLAYVAACGGAGEDLQEWERRWRDLARQVREAEVQGRAEEEGDGPSPYRGLAAFGRDDSGLFFGRDRLTAELLALVDTHRCTAVIGPSGSGKSSLLLAGLVPRLERNDEGGGDGGGTGRRERPASIRPLTPGGRPFDRLRKALVPAPGVGETVVIVDQFEELFTLYDDRDARAGFVEELLAAARDPARRLRVVLGIRADFYGRCLQHPGLADVLREAALPVGPMTKEELGEAVSKPARERGLFVRRELTDRLVAETLGEPGGLPLMSHALLETWRRRIGRNLTLDSYEAAGGLRGAIAQTAETVYADLSPGQAALARRVLLRLVTPGERLPGEGPSDQYSSEGAPDTRRPAERAELHAVGGPDPAGVDEVLERLARARLLILDGDTVDLAHEALLTAWPRLRAWIDENRRRLLLHRRLTQDAHGWEKSGRDSGALYRGVRLAEAEGAFAGGGDTAFDELTPGERDFLLASRFARRRERRRWRVLRVVAGTTVVALLVALSVAWQRDGEADRRREEAAARRVAALADSLRSSDPVLSMRLSAAARRISDTTETRAALLEAATQPEVDALTLPIADAEQAVQPLLSADGRTLVEAGAKVRAWDVSAHQDRELLAEESAEWGDGEEWGWLDLSPDGRRMLATGPDQGTYLHDVSGGPTDRGKPFPEDFWQPVFGPSGRTALSFSGTLPGEDDDEGVRLWDLATRRVLFTAGTALQGRVITNDGERALSSLDVPPAEGGTDSVEETSRDMAGVSADDRLVALCTDSGSLQVWKVRENRRVNARWVTDASPSVCDSAYRPRFVPRSNRLVALTDDGIRMWDTDTGEKLPLLPFRTPGGVAFSADGAYMAAYNDTGIGLWRLGSESRTVLRFALRQEKVVDLRIDAAQGVVRYLAASGGRTTRVRTVAFDTVTTTSRWEESPPVDARFGPDGTLLARVSATAGTARFELRRTGDGTRRALPSAPCPSGDEDTCVVLLAFGSDGRTLAYGTSAEERPTDASGGIVLPDDPEPLPMPSMPSMPSGEPSVEPTSDDPLSLDDLPDDLPHETPSPGEDGGNASAGAGATAPVTVWDIGRGRRTASLDLRAGSEEFHVDGLALSADSNSLLVHRFGDAGWEQWGVRDGKRERRVEYPDAPASALVTGVSLPGNGIPARALDLGPGGRLMATVTGRVTELPAGRTTNRSLSPEGVGVLRFSPAGDRLAAGDSTGWVHLWDGPVVHRLAAFVGTQQDELAAMSPSDGPEVEGEPVSALAFSPDGKTLAVGGASGTLRLWDVASAQPLGSPLPTSGDGILDLAFSRDGASLLASGAHVPLRTYPVSADRTTAAVCQRADGGLTREQWRLYLPEVPYRRVCDAA
ncbi:nSTAND1 domain-containing NTPase [Streptomyces sp. DSM 40750]|uniref:nSTAND1 domain-containing NTPase n=1 Tax=Streptomyces sp. DSM 40750 TaxID=2801030 RepID=UPI00214B64D0|nr:hypothetical protein [Streptomyces sp. DSM 40750]UUU23082.1 hypothetical protein JIX55_23865 [Streptomyces sp. DSM 40750]